jgi:hypothetical protein
MTARQLKRRLVLRYGLAPFIAVAFLLLVLPAASQTDDLDVLKVIPENYKLLLENPFVRVIEARVPAGTTEPPHRHLRGVSVCMTEYTIESKALPNGQWVRSERKLGTVYWSEASLHQLRNVGKTTSHTIRIELKY